MQRWVCAAPVRSQLHTSADDISARQAERRAGNSISPNQRLSGQKTKSARDQEREKARLRELLRAEYNADRVADADAEHPQCEDGKRARAGVELSSVHERRQTAAADREQHGVDG